MVLLQFLLYSLWCETQQLVSLHVLTVSSNAKKHTQKTKKTNCIQSVRSVGSSQDYDSLCIGHAIHLCQQLIQCLIVLITREIHPGKSSLSCIYNRQYLYMHTSQHKQISKGEQIYHFILPKQERKTNRTHCIFSLYR